MSSRVSFSVYEVGGLATNLVASDFEVYKNGVLDASLVVTPNNDGTYYFTISESAKYRLKIKASWQDEYYDIYLVTDDNLVQGDADDSSLEFSSDLHIKDLGVSTAKIAAEAVTTAKIAADAIDGTKIADDSVDSEHLVADSIDNEHVNWGTGGGNINSESLPIKDAGGYFTGTQTEQALQALGTALGIADNSFDFSSSTYLTTISTVAAALLKLDRLIGGAGPSNYRTIIDEMKAAAAAAAQTPGAYTAWQETGAAYVEKIKVYFYKRPSDNTVSFTFEAQWDTNTSVIKIVAGGQTTELDLSGQSESIWVENTITVDITGVSTGLAAVVISMKAAAGGTNQMRYPVVSIESST